ncbi:MAG TPA: diguanylate cyclase [Blastocatellia bacterium]|nr:diguanylate cyclase [Blastocatellia bacterium]
MTVWLRLQRSLAEKSGIALTTLSREGAVIGRIENDNSLCQAMRLAPEYASRCQADCTAAYNNAVEAGRTVEFCCHAGLHGFATPVTINDKQLVILGGRAFSATAEYADFLTRYGDLDGIISGDALRNVKFVDARDLREAAELVASTAEYHFQTAARAVTRPEEAKASPDLLDAHLEIIRLADELESKNRSIASLHDFLRGVVTTLDSQKVYPSVLAKFSEIMKAERSSLMVLNEQANELALEASLPTLPATATPIRMKPGEGIAGAVLESGAAMLVHDADSDPRVPRARRSLYKSKSFISYPIMLGLRKVGVINLTDRADGSPYQADDLGLLDLIAPHLALIIDRTEWFKKAEAYQRMSLTDPLTALPNRRYLEERLFEEVERSKRHSTPLSFMIIDVDRFKSYNDIYGHTNADRVLTKTAQMLRRSIRAIDMAARFAGDEFCILLPETELADAARIAERLRKAVGQIEYRSEQGELMERVTISIGVSSFSPSRQSPLSIVETADRALYQAKTRGRNCVAVYEDSQAIG